jgi:hypothetical protein
MSSNPIPAADLAALALSLEERCEQRGEARLGRAPLAQQDDEVLADRDQGAGCAG